MKDFYTYQFDDLSIYQTPTLWNTYRNYNYIVARGNHAIVIDPGEKEPILKTIESNNLQVQSIYLTHHHPDHTGATQSLKKVLDCEVIGFQGDQKRLPILSKSYYADETLDILEHKVHVMHLPGHTHGLCAFHFTDAKLLFSNDLIFSIGCGRVFEGTFQQMFESLKQVRELADDTVLFCSHEYTQQNLAFARGLFPEDQRLQEAEAKIQTLLANHKPTVPTTLDFEKKHNPFLRWDDPAIRKAMELEAAEDWQVFAEIRRLKDIS